MIVIILANQNNKEYIYKTKTVTQTDTVVVIDTFKYYISIEKEKLVPYKVVEYIDSTENFTVLDSLRDYSITALDTDSAKVIANLQTRGVLTKADFDIQLYPTTKTITKTTTVTNYVRRDGVYVAAFASTQSDLVVGLLATKNSWVYGGFYSPSSGQVLLGVGYRLR